MKKLKDFIPDNDGDHFFAAVGDKSFCERLAQRRYDPANPPAESEPIFSIKNVKVSTSGNMTTLSAQSKNGKTSTIEAMIASIYCERGADCLGFEASNPKGEAVIRIDTELSPFDHHQSNQRIVSRAGKVAPPWLYSFCLTDFPPAGVRRAIRATLEIGAKNCGGVLALIVDGIADAVSDVNDAREANGLVAELHALAIEFSCAIVAVIHLNPSSDFKTRGHLGSQLERKAETNLRLEKDTDEIITLFADKNRHAPIRKATGPRFAWSNQTGMHVSVITQQEARNDIEREEFAELAAQLFSERKAMKFSELVVAIKSALTVSEATAIRKLKRCCQLGVIRKTVANLYELGR